MILSEGGREWNVITRMVQIDINEKRTAGNRLLRNDSFFSKLPDFEPV